MGNSIYMGSGIPVFFDAEDIPNLDKNPRGEHLIKIAAAFEQKGIDGVRVECIKGEDDRFFVVLHLLSGSLGKWLLDKIAENGEKTNSYPTVEASLAIAKRVQNMEGARHE